MSDERPNILLLMTDQHRGDGIGLETPILQTPQLDRIATAGVHCQRAYSACPVCVPARRTLMTGRRPSSHGVMMNYHTHLDQPTLPHTLGEAGYQTALCGKLHLWPHFARHGFEHFAWSDGPFAREMDDYQRYLRREGVRLPDTSQAHGVGANATPVRPWHLDENLHFSNWCVTEALEFLERRDPTRPFFLNVSFLHPHQPYTPPRFYYDRYMAMAEELPEPVVGDWARVYDQTTRGSDPQNTWRLNPPRRVMQEMRAGYYACINHIDDQIGRLLLRLPKNTVVVFCSDHGEMLGDHQWLRKRTPYEPSARVPMMFQFRGTHDYGVTPGQKIDRPVELMDLMPTLLELAGAPIPESVEGASLLPLMRDPQSAWREYVHGECAAVTSADSGMQYLTDGRRKYIWWPGQGREQFFNLEADPQELHDLAQAGERSEEIATWRERLVAELTGRPEGFVQEGKLVKLAGPTSLYMPGYERHE